MSRRFAIFVLAGSLLGLGLLGFGISSLLVRDELHDYRAGALPSLVGSSPDQLPSTPTSEAPPYVGAIKAVGCAQRNSATIPAGNGLLLQNTGTIQLRIADGALATPTWPLAPGAWIHFGFGPPGLYRITGTRYSCTNAGIAAPHFTLDITVTE